MRPSYTVKRMEHGVTYRLLKNAYVRIYKLKIKFYKLLMLLYYLVLPCASQPPPAPQGEGAERIYNTDITNYRCPNGYLWETGKL